MAFHNFGFLDGHELLVCRQVDDFAAGSPTELGTRVFIETIRKFVAAEFNAMGIKTDQGTYERFNGMDVYQTRDYIKIGCETYIDRVLETHGWASPTHKDPENLVPLRPEIQERLMKLQGPDEKSPESAVLVKKHGFSYRNLLGELVYAFVICRLDIGFAICFLARFATGPHDEHFRALKNVCRYLRKRKDWGIIYRRVKPIMALPFVPFDFLTADPDLPVFPELAFDELAGIYDAAHATDSKLRRSVTGLMIIYCKAAIAYKSRLQTVTATSSTEAEFYAGVTCAKMLRYLRSVLAELGFLKAGASRCFTDNMANINIVNDSKPTPRTRHVEIQHFAIQSWREAGEIIMSHLAGVINPSDDLTKALIWALHGRHSRRAMGHYGPPLAPFDEASDLHQVFY